MFSKTLVFFLLSFFIFGVVVRVVSSTMVIGDDVVTAVGGMVVAGAAFLSEAEVHDVSSNVTGAVADALNNRFDKLLVFVTPTLVVFVFIIADNEGENAWDKGVFVSLVEKTLNRVFGDAGITVAPAESLSSLLIMVVVAVGIVFVIIVTAENTFGE